MSKMKKVVGSVLAILTLFGCGSSKQTEEGRRLVSVSYYHGGGMENYTYTMELKYDGKNVVFEENDNGKIKKKKADKDALKNFTEYLETTDYKQWDTYQKDEEFVALDAPTHSVRVTFEPWEYYCLDSDVLVPEQYRDVYHQIKEFLESFK
ncbi:MAG: hypothetical protein HUJ58_06295 [Erysipelotrichaceae bacterium]|nr:hypothetical protein [Erysipelotrichaceae bacterium]